MKKHANLSEIKESAQFKNVDEKELRGTNGGGELPSFSNPIGALPCYGILPGDDILIEMGKNALK